MRAITNGDQAAHHEILKAFRGLSELRRRFREELEPAPRRYQGAGHLMGRAFALFDSAAVAFEEASGPVVDFDRLETVAARLQEGGRLLRSITEPATEPDQPSPLPARKPRRVNSARATHD